jgi:hypothetical protein
MRYSCPASPAENRYARHLKELRSSSRQSTMNGIYARRQGHQATRVWAVEYAIHCTPPKISFTFHAPVDSETASGNASSIPCQNGQATAARAKIYSCPEAPSGKRRSELVQPEVFGFSSARSATAFRSSRKFIFTLQPEVGKRDCRS